MTEPVVRLDLILGRCEIETRQIPGPDDDILFQGRSRRFDRYGQLVEETPWTTNIRMYWPKPEPKVPWWKRLFA